MSASLHIFLGIATHPPGSVSLTGPLELRWQTLPRCLLHRPHPAIIGRQLLQPIMANGRAELSGEADGLDVPPPIIHLALVTFTFCPARTAADVSTFSHNAPVTQSEPISRSLPDMARTWPPCLLGVEPRKNWAGRTRRRTRLLIDSLKWELVEPLEFCQEQLIYVLLLLQPPTSSAPPPASPSGC